MNSITLPPLPQACALLFNISSPQREKSIRIKLSSMNIVVRVVSTAEQIQTLGRLSGMPNCSTSAAAHAVPFQDEMLVMSMFTRAQMDEFLQFFHDSGLPPIELKAVVTPANASWTAVKLHRELKKEYRSIR